ncbi:MAG TPA: YbhN family protein [Actinomycetota bacterium]|nr:YbhN family protein [Actinomycetota bacterium]
MPLAPSASSPSAKAPYWRRVISRHPVRRLVLVLVMAAVVEYLVLPQIVGLHKSVHLLGRVNLGYVLLGVALQAASLASYARLTQILLPKGVGRFSRVWRIDLATLAISHILPGGAAGGEALGFRLLTGEGATGPEAGFVLATQGLGSAVVLNLILWLALVVSIPVSGFNPLYGLAAAVGGAAIGLFAAAVVLLTRGQDRAARWVGALARRLPYVRRFDMERIVHDLARRIQTLTNDRALLRRALGWACLNWVLDAASLYIFLAAFGHFENPDGLLVAYGIANVLAAIPVTPGGLGVVEGILVPTLVGFGSPRGIAVLGVLAYRLVQFWLPIPVGAACYVALGRRKPVIRDAQGFATPPDGNHTDGSKPS